MSEKRCFGLSSSERAWGPPVPRGVAGLRSVFRAITTTCSERPPLVRHARGGTLTSVRRGRGRPAGSPPPAQAARKPQVEIGRSEDARARSSQCVRVAAKQLGRLLPPGTCRDESAPTRRANDREATRRPISAAPRRRRRTGRSGTGSRFPQKSLWDPNARSSAAVTRSRPKACSSHRKRTTPSTSQRPDSTA